MNVVKWLIVIKYKRRLSWVVERTKQKELKGDMIDFNIGQRVEDYGPAQVLIRRRYQFKFIK